VCLSSLSEPWPRGKCTPLHACWRRETSVEATRAEGACASRHSTACEINRVRSDMYVSAPHKGPSVASPVRFRQEMTEHVNAELKLFGTPHEIDELVDVLVRDCGCGCSLRDRELVSPTQDCAAMRALRDRRFILGMLFARRLRRQLEAEERIRLPLPPRCRPM
jgi:hypothetical protein